jgi:hypothetical protein
VDRPNELRNAEPNVDRIKTLNVLLIVTYRPEFEPPWAGRPYVTTVSLNRLGVRPVGGEAPVTRRHSDCGKRRCH